MKSKNTNSLASLTVNKRRAVLSATAAWLVLTECFLVLPLQNR